MATRVALSLISHTNAGKTTLARTLLGRDVGEVRDEAHVTQESESWPLVDTPEGDALVLWDTPGFGDSARLAKRLAQQGNPIGWFLTQVWDRFRDRTFWLTQKAVGNVRDEADVVLYLVNASEEPADAGYLAPELAVLEWLGKPVIVLLNQTGPPRPHEEEAADEARWRSALGHRGFVHAVLALDAFARCWVQEVELLRVVGDSVRDEKRDGYARLVAAWQARREAQFAQSMSVLAGSIAAAALDREPVPEAGLKGTLRELGRSIGIARDEGEDAKARAAEALASRLDAGVRDSIDRLIAIHGLSGRASDDVRARLAQRVKVDQPVSEGKAAMMGGVVSGALSGLAADLAAGGFTFGAGMLAGAVLGALGGAGLARGVNLARGKGGASVRWDDAFLDALVASALLRYLAVAHYGRGRGDWAESEYPPHWPPEAELVVASHRVELAHVWSMRGDAGDANALAEALDPVLTSMARQLLAALYPGKLGSDSSSGNWGQTPFTASGV
jgi:hypothetical protein